MLKTPLAPNLVQLQGLSLEFVVNLFVYLFNLLKYLRTCGLGHSENIRLTQKICTICHGRVFVRHSLAHFFHAPYCLGYSQTNITEVINTPYLCPTCFKKSSQCFPYGVAHKMPDVERLHDIRVRVQPSPFSQLIRRSTPTYFSS